MYKKIILACLTTISSYAMEETKSNSQKSNNCGASPSNEINESEKKEIATILLSLYKSQPNLTTKTDINKPKCNYCNNTFINNQSLSNHISLYHTKRYFCTYNNCKKSYKLINNLKKHIKTHEKKKAKY